VNSVILVNGPGGQGRVVLDALQASGRRVAGVLDDVLQPGSSLLGAEVLGPVSSWKLRLDSGFEFVVAINNPAFRRDLADDIVAAGGLLAGVVHPAATVSPHARLKRGVIILGGTVVGPDATIGDYSLLNANCAVDHDCVLGVGVTFGPGVTLAGVVTVGDGAFIGVGATVMPGVTIGENAVVGAGSVVIRPVPEGATVAGNPAKPLPPR
jgi:sugar O-acyltransferase (sialic acid O-acetyltransferase NeuD family)